MIFKQVQEIINGTKTQTRRIVKPGEELRYEPWVNPCRIYSAVFSKGWSREAVWAGSRRKWIVGSPNVHGADQTYAVVPGRGKPGVWWKDDPRFGISTWPALGYVSYGEGVTEADITPDVLKMWGYKPLRIRILSIRREHVQDISEQDALAEGVQAMYADDVCVIPARDNYRALWESINGKTKGARWNDNPEVWVLTFEVAE